MAYCVRADIEGVFGVENVQTWGNLEDGDIALQPVLDAITARITRAIADSQAEIDAKLLGGPYGIPFAEPVEIIVRMVCELLAGVALYEARGVQDYATVDPRIEGGTERKPAHRLAWHRSRALQMLNELLTGRIQLNLTKTGTNLPEVADINPYPQTLERN